MISRQFSYCTAEMTIAALIIILAAIAAIPIPGLALNTTSNHYKFCVNMKDKKLRSIFCPDVWNSNETSTKLYG